jgi:serine protease Do
VKVLDVDEESAAGKAGIKEDDIITEFDGKTVNSADELAVAARDSREKAAVTVKLKRDGKVQSVEIKTPRKLRTANL